MGRLARGVRRRVARASWSPLGTVTRLQGEEPIVALTFDDGPDPRFTPEVLDLLDRYGARASFFMIGVQADRHPDLVEAVARRGHTVGNHTHTHPTLPLIGGRRRREELRKCRSALAPHGSRLFRPPRGSQNTGSRLDAFLCGYRTVGWSVAVDDWRPHRPDWLARRLREELEPGAVVLLHDGLWDPPSAEAADRGPVIEGLRILLEEVGDRYQFLSLEEAVDRAKPVSESWFVPSPEEPARR